MYELIKKEKYCELICGSIILKGQCLNHEQSEVYWFTDSEVSWLCIKYEDIKKLEIEQIPENIEFSIDIWNSEDEHLLNIPYPFNDILFCKNNNNLVITLTSVTEGLEWEKHWSIEPFFDEFINQAKQVNEINVILSDEKYSTGKVNIEKYDSKSKTIEEALRSFLPVIESIVDKTDFELAGLSNLQRVLDIWNSNAENSNEEFWQKVLLEYSWVIAQTFSIPVMLYEDKAYLGGKNIDNKNGNIIDFLYKNQLTQNLALIEIKTPLTPLTGGLYRDIHSISNDLSGSIVQILKYKDICQKNFYNLHYNSNRNYEVFNPKCLLIIGRLQCLNKKERITFELFRNEMSTVDIITFDELFEKISIILNISRGSREQKDIT